MNILIVDRDEVAARLIKSRLEARGHVVFTETAKDNVVNVLTNENIDLVFLDPLPLNNCKPVVLNIRRLAQRYTYTVLLSENGSLEEATAAGMNDFVPKPLDMSHIETVTGNAERLLKLMVRLGNDSEDFPSAGGVISKSAFNQLFLSGIDRAGRYKENTYIVFIRMVNYKDLMESDGPYAANYAAAYLSRRLVLLRRQSDIIGQTAKYEYGLLLQRPIYETEPIEAANRFASSLAEESGADGHDGGSNQTPAEIQIALVELPTGAKLADHRISIYPKEKQKKKEQELINA